MICVGGRLLFRSGADADLRQCHASAQEPHPQQPECNGLSYSSRRSSEFGFLPYALTYVGSVSMFRDMNKAIALHRLKPVVDRVFGFEEASEALTYLESGKHSGKVVVTTT